MSKLTKLINNPYKFLKDSLVFSKYMYRNFDLEEVCEYIQEVGDDKPLIILIFFAKWKNNFIPDYLDGYNIAILKKEYHVYPIVKSIIEREDAEALVWGMSGSKYMRRIINSTKVTRVEDGFIRSKEIGLTKSSPISLVFDKTGIHYDASKPSDLEGILNNIELSPHEEIESAEIIELIVNKNISKYNDFQDIDSSALFSDTKDNILVIGQVEDDKSIFYSLPESKIGMNELLEIAIQENPNANIIYKIHPDIISGIKKNKKIPSKLKTQINILDINIPHNKIYEKIDKVYTISSLMGFEAILRDKKVVCLGAPFYSGWGLTDDRYKISRRNKSLSKEELAYAAYIKYPKYINPVTHVEINCLRAIDALNDNNSHYYESVWLDFYNLIRKNKNASNSEKRTILNCSDNDFLKKNYIIAEEVINKLQTNSILEELCKTEIAIIKQDYEFIVQSFYNVIKKGSLLNTAQELLGSVFSKCNNENSKIISALIIQESPNNSILCSRAAYFLSNSGYFSEANLLYKKALKDSSLSILGRYNIIYKSAALYSHVRQHAESLKLSDKLLNLGINKDKTFYLLAETKLMQMQFNEAIKYYNNISITSHSYFNSRYKIACCYKFLGDYKLAKKQIKKLLLFRPDHYEALEMLQYLDKQLLKSPQTLEQLSLPYLKNKHLVKLDRYYITKARLLIALGRFDDAIEVIRNSKTTADRHNYKLLLQWEINIMIMSGKYDEAINRFKKIIRNNEYNFFKISDLIIFYINLEGYDDYIKDFLEKEQNRHNSQALNQKMANINVFIYEKMCDINNLFLSFRKRFKIGKIYNIFKHHLNYVQSLNDINKLDDTLIVSTNGPGDELHYSSLYNEANNAVNNITVTCDNRIKPLFSRSFKNIKFIGVDKKGLRVALIRSNEVYKKKISKLPDCFLISMFDNESWLKAKKADKVILSTDLFYDLRNSYNKYPKNNVYLQANHEKQEEWKNIISNVTDDNKIRVGIAWRSGISNVHRDRHYTSLNEWKKLFEHSDKFEFINIQYDNPLEEIANVEEKFGIKIHNFVQLDLMDDFDGMAAFLKNLDYVICPSTYIAELSGGLGVKGILLDPCNSAKWKQLPNTNIHACYNNFRVFTTKDTYDNQIMFKQVVDHLLENI